MEASSWNQVAGDGADERQQQRKEMSYQCLVAPEALLDAAQVEDALTQVEFLRIQFTNGSVLLLQRLAWAPTKRERETINIFWHSIKNSAGEINHFIHLL